MRTNLITRLKEEWNNLDPVDPLRGLIADAIDALAEAQQQEPVEWRELCRRLYMELYWCDRQMMETLDQDGEPMWTQGKEVRDVLADAKAALETSPQSEPWVGLTEDERNAIGRHHAYVDNIIRATEAKLREKNAQPRKPLTDEQIEQCMKQAYATVQGRNLEHAFARAIEAAHGIKGDA